MEINVKPKYKPSNKGGTRSLPATPHKWPTGSWKRSNFRFLDAPIYLCKISFLIRPFLLWKPQKSKMITRGPKNVLYTSTGAIICTFWGVESHCCTLGPSSPLQLILKVIWSLNHPIFNREITKYVDFEALAPKFVLALEPTVLKLDGSSFGRPFIYVLKGCMYKPAPSQNASKFGHQIINLSFLNLKPNFNATVLRTQEIVVGN